MQCGTLDMVWHQSSLAQLKCNPAKESIHRNNTHENPRPFPRSSGCIPVRSQYAGSADLTLIGEVGDVHALTARAAGVVPFCEFVYHHALEDVCLGFPLEMFCST